MYKQILPVLGFLTVASCATPNPNGYQAWCLYHRCDTELVIKSEAPADKPDYLPATRLEEHGLLDGSARVIARSPAVQLYSDHTTTTPVVEGADGTNQEYMAMWRSSEESLRIGDLSDVGQNFQYCRPFKGRVGSEEGRTGRRIHGLYCADRRSYSVSARCSAVDMSWDGMTGRPFRIVFNRKLHSVKVPAPRGVAITVSPVCSDSSVAAN